ncbi:MAG: MFS transporter [Thermoplasmata archaeon]
MVMFRKYSPFGFAQFGYSIFSNTIPIFVVLVLGMGAFEIGLLNTIVSVFSMAGILFWGRMIDRTALRKLFSVLGFVGASAGVVLAIFSTSYQIVMGSCILLGLFFSVFGVLGSTLVCQERNGKYWQRLKAYNTVIYTGALFGLCFAVIVLTFTSGEFGLRFLLLFAFASFVFGLLFSSYILPIRGEHMPRLSKSELIKINTSIIERLHYLPSKLRHSLGLGGLNPRIYGICIGLGLMVFAFSGFYTTLPILLIGKDVGGNGIFLVHLIGVSACTVAFLTARKNPPVKTLQRFVGLRVAIILFFVALLPLNSPFLVLLLAVCFNGILGWTWARISSSSVEMVVKYTNDYNAGRAMGAYHLGISIGTAAGAITGGLLYINWGATSYFLLGLFAIAGLGIAIMSHEGRG